MTSEAPAIDPAAAAEAALRRGDAAAAARLAEGLTRAAPGDPQGWFLLGMAEEMAGRAPRAITLIEAAAARGGDPVHLAELARLLAAANRDADAGDAARRAWARGGGDAHALDTIGCVLARIGDNAGAIAPFEAAIALTPANGAIRFNLAAALGFVGRTADAEAHYERLLADDPGDARAHYALAMLRRQTRATCHVTRLEAALAAAADPGARLRLRFALAKELEDIGDPGAMFGHLSRANGDLRRASGYEFARDAAMFDAIEAAFADPGAIPGTGDPDEAPIFVLGMPRTGTTLVDRILSSHPDVASGGELRAMPIAVKRLAGTPGAGVIDAATMRASGRIDAAALGRAYRAMTAPQRGDRARFTDKLPVNFLYAGHIARALPHARIVCLERHPLDTVWSNFKHLFAPDAAQYRYALDPVDAARYVVRFRRLLALWDRLFPGRILRLSYERLVAEQETVTRALLAHCGLAWDAACLDFHENTSAVATPSAPQVRRPLNADAIARWRQHADALEPARQVLLENGIAVD